MGKDKGFFRQRSSVEVYLYEELDWNSLESEYQQHCCHHSAEHYSLNASSQPPDWADILAAQWLELIWLIYQEREIPKAGFSTEIVRTTGKELSKAVDKGFKWEGGV